MTCIGPIDICHTSTFNALIFAGKAWKRMVTKACFVGEGFTRKPPKFERFIRPMVSIYHLLVYKINKEWTELKSFADSKLNVPEMMIIPPFEEEGIYCFALVHLSVCPSYTNLSDQ